MDKTIFQQLGSKPITGKISNTSIQIRKRIDYRNSFQTTFSATIEAITEGARISGKMGLHPFVTKFSILWMVSVMIAGGPSFFLSLMSVITNGYDATGPSLFDLFLFPLMMAAALLIFKAGKHYSKPDADFILEFLKKLLEAKLIENVE